MDAMTSRALPVLLVLVGAGCGSPAAAPEAPPDEAPSVEERAASEEEPSETPPPSAEGPQSDTPLPERMHEHFTLAVAARDALTQADVEGARGHLTALAELPPTASYPATWQPQLVPFQTAARAAAAATDLDALALAVADVGLACAGCHQAVGAEIAFDETGGPPTSDDPASHMLRHQWAADRMWEGLMAPADERYLAGAGALAEAPLEPTEVAEGLTVGPEVTALAARVHDLGRQASVATGAAVRARHYGEFLATCASCHDGVPES
jgi:cytochrome c553